MANKDIKISEISKQELSGLKNSQLVLELSGKSVNFVIVNTIRRLLMDYIPTYSFCEDTIEIAKNNTVFNNDEMKLRLSQMTIQNISNNINYLEKKYWKNVDYSDKNREKHPNDNELIEMYVNVNNNSESIFNITTNHVRFYRNGEEMKNMFSKEYPSLLIQLRRDEHFSCRCVAVLGIGKSNNIWAGAGNCYYEELDSNKYRLTIESLGQMDEYELLFKACEIYKEKLGFIKETFKELYKTSQVKDQKNIKIKLEEEDNTIGNLINYYLQDDKDVIFSGISKPDLLIEEVQITIKTLKPDPLKNFLNSIDRCISTFDLIQKEFKIIGKKYI